MKKFFKCLGAATAVVGIMIVGGLADRHSEKFSEIVTGTESGTKKVKNYLKGIIKPK